MKRLPDPMPPKRCAKMGACRAYDLRMRCDVRSCFLLQEHGVSRGPLRVEMVGLVAAQVRAVAAARGVRPGVIVDEACERMCCDGATVAEPMG